MEFYTWQNYRCAYEKVPARSEEQAQQPTNHPALLLIHPVGVGLSGSFWHPFVAQWRQTNEPRGAIYNPDLLGCGESDLPRRAYTPEDWAQQLAYFVEEVVQAPVVLVVQGALLPVAVRLMETAAGKWVKGLVLSGPPAWRLMTTPTPGWKHQLAWSFFSSPLGNAFYRYARREAFLRSFSQRQLFENAEDVTDGWLAMLNAGSRDLNSRYAVFSFLAGFWRQDYAPAIARIQQPVLIVLGEAASTIDRTTSKALAKEAAQPTATNLPKVADSTAEAPAPSIQRRLQDYLDHFPRAQGAVISGRNVLPYESTDEFVSAIAPFVAALS